MEQTEIQDVPGISDYYKKVQYCVKTVKIINSFRQE
jgi:hypothetical protein